MMTSFTDWESGLYLVHHGVKGQKWGQRRFQNEDGSLTAAGKEHYYSSTFLSRRYERKASSMAKKADHATDNGLNEKTQKKAWKYMDKAFKYEQRAAKLNAKGKQKKLYKTVKKEIKKNKKSDVMVSDDLREKIKNLISEDKLNSVKKDAINAAKLGIKRDNYVKQNFNKKDSKTINKIHSLNDKTRKAWDNIDSKIESITNESLGKYGNKKPYRHAWGNTKDFIERVIGQETRNVKQEYVNSQKAKRKGR